ncbi:MAG TPA: hypothetical protein VFB94_07245 [Acidimicrobiales bacterium]|nr:hypothetical protein [Acidimicrobiales bacterium]
MEDAIWARAARPPAPHDVERLAVTGPVVGARRAELIEGAGHALIHSHVDRCVAALTAAHA